MFQEAAGFKAAAYVVFWAILILYINNKMCYKLVGVLMTEKLNPNNAAARSRAWIRQLQSWETLGDGLTNPGSVAIPNLEFELQECKKAGIDIKAETGLTEAQIKELCEKVKREWRTRAKEKGVIKKWE